MTRCHPISIVTASILAVLLLGVSPDALFAQRVLLFEDFENATPDLPANEGVESVDTYNRSIVTEEDPAIATVTGGMFADPFDPGNNKSLVLHNPNNAAQQAVNWFSIFPEDENDPNFFLKNGVIEFDAYLGPVIPGAWWTFLDIRFGFERNSDNRNQVATGGDETIWTAFQMTEAGLAMGPDRFHDYGNADDYVDTTDLIVVEQAMHVRYDINGNTNTYKVTIDNLEDQLAPVELMFDSGTANQPFKEHFNFETFQFEPAPGINEISFLTDASVRSAGATAHSDVFIDNLLIIDNDLPPIDDLEGDYNLDGTVNAADYTVWRDGGSPDDTIAGYNLWRANFGNSGSGVGSSSVPEPSSSILIAMLAAGFALWTRQRFESRVRD
jgi:hypothetical protein